MSIFSLELDISGVTVLGIHKKNQRKMKFIRENDSEAVLATFCCYNYSVNALEAVEKIGTDQKDHPCVLHFAA